MNNTSYIVNSWIGISLGINKYNQRERAIVR